MQKKILIVGCSWGCGEWDTKNSIYQITHHGIAKYLKDKNFIVENCSIPGGNNNDSLYQLKKNHKNFDIKIFIVTEPFRDFRDDPNLHN